MQFNSLSIHLESDGFRLENPGHNVPSGTPLVAYCQLPSGWKSIDLVFVPTGWSILHPFTHEGMFVYTGEEPLRVVVKLASGAPLPPRPVEDDGYPAGMLCCYPMFSDDIWSDGSLLALENSGFSQPMPPISEDASLPSDDVPDNQPLPSHFGGIGALEVDIDPFLSLEDPDPEPASLSDDSIPPENPDPSDPNAN